MTKVNLRNEKHLVPFLSSHRFNYEVVQDGWGVDVWIHNKQELFNAGKMFGDYLIKEAKESDTKTSHPVS